MTSPLIWSDDDNVSATFGSTGLLVRNQSRDNRAAIAHVRHRAALACHACRALHARCDGQTPTCNRCKEEQRVCCYPKSRRRRSSPISPAHPALPSPPTDYHWPDSSTSTYFSSNSRARALPTPEDTHRLYNVSVSASMNIGETLPTPEMDPAVAQMSSPTSESLDNWIRDKSTDRSINLYYQCFHTAHPFAPPKTYMKSQVEHGNTGATTLFATMSHVGDIYMYQQLEGSPRLSIPHQLLAASLRRGPTPPLCDSQIVYHISALLLASIAAFGQGEDQEAGEYMEKAVLTTTEAGMNRRERTINLKLQDPVVAEMWIRTYWQLHIMIEALQNESPSTENKRKFLLEHLPADFPLPNCHESLSIMKTLSTFDLADFEDHAPEFSSLVYLIDLIRVSRSIKRLLAAQSSANERERMPQRLSAVFRADALLVNWKLRLPPEKQRSVTKMGELDDIMLQSHLLFNSLRAFIHTPSVPALGERSRFVHDDGHDSDASIDLIHTRTRLEAFDGAINLITLHPSFLGSSPLNIKPLTRCAMASLSAHLTVNRPICSVVGPPPIEVRAHIQMVADSDGDFSRENLRLALGALKQTSRVWKLAQTKSNQLKALARTYYSPPLAAPPATQLRLTSHPPSQHTPSLHILHVAGPITTAMRDNAYNPDPVLPLTPSAVLEDRDHEHQLQKSRETRADDLLAFDRIIGLQPEDFCQTLGIDAELFPPLQFSQTLGGLGRSGNVES